MNKYARLMRLDRPVGIWLLFLPSVWGLALGSAEKIMLLGSAEKVMSLGPERVLTLDFIHMLLLFFIGAILMRSAGCIANDMWDRKLDAQVARTKSRPLASGEIKLREAIFLLFILLSLALLVWWQLPWLAKILSLAALVLVFAYPAMKRITWWPQAFLGVTFNLGIVIGAAAFGAPLTPAVLFLYLGAVFWTIGYDTVYAHQDIEDDRNIGIKSTAIRFAARPRHFVALCYALAVLLWWCGAWAAHFPWWGYVGLVAIAMHLLWQLARWNPKSESSSLQIFKANVQTAAAMALLLFAVAA